MNKIFKLMKLVLFFILTLSSLLGLSQTTDEKMASYYFESADFEKAKMYYEKVFKTNKSRNVYENYMATLLELKEYKIAKKVTKKLIKKNPHSFFYKINYGEIMEYEDGKNKSNKYFEKLIDDLDSKTQLWKFGQLSQEFSRIGKTDLALKTLEKGESFNTKKDNRFSVNIAMLYGQKGETNKMIDAYLKVVETQPRQISRVKGYLTKSIDFDSQPKKVEILRKKLLRKIQKNPENESYSDLLIWMFQLTNDFESAFIQVKAKDKRMKSKGTKLFTFGLTCRYNKKYDLAIKAFEYAISQKTTGSGTKKRCRILALKTLKEKIISNAHYTKNDLLTLNNKYISTLSKIDFVQDKIGLLQDLANLQGFYLHNIDTAEIIIKSILNTRGISRKQKANNKIQLADIYMLKNEIWDASLLYMQVEKENKHDIIGSKAKFKNAKLYYYSGDFEWSQNQLEGLKASTSKLISNDAIDLSLLITDNYNMDTTPINMQRFAQADLLIFQNKFAEANLKLDTINKESPAHSLNDEILFRRYEIAYKKQDFATAKTYLNEIMTEYSQDILADNAIFKLAELEENQLNNKKNAIELYGKIMFDYPGSLFVVEARKRYRKLNLGKKEINVIEKDKSKMSKKEMFQIGTK